MNLSDGCNAIHEIHEEGRGGASPLPVTTTMGTERRSDLSCCSSRLVGAQRRCARLSIDGLDSLYRETGIQIGF